ncbi:hypothetical protein, partial [Shewanella sp.]|uniref:hypothetical protein n=1 Tax=Shewanella sp. TaxID=50422 RepID=UPI004047766B
RLGIFHLPKLKIITIGNLPVKPPQRNDLNQLASLIPGAIQSNLIGLDLDELKELAANAEIEVYTADSDSEGAFAVLCEELARQTPNSELLSMALVLKGIRWASNRDDVLFRLKEKDITAATEFVCAQGWRRLHRMQYECEWNGIPLNEFFTKNPLESEL